MEFFKNHNKAFSVHLLASFFQCRRNKPLSMIIFSQKRKFLPYVLIVISAIAASTLVYWKYLTDMEVSRRNYIQEEHLRMLEVSQKIENVFRAVYQNFRTISRLPGVKKIDRHAQNLDDDADLTIKEIYNNLANNISISELYIVPVDFQPEKIDPYTGKPEKPIKMYDDLIVGTTVSTGTDGKSNPVEEIEIHEYRLLKKQLAWLKKFFPGEHDLEVFQVPAVSGHEVITCDNSRLDPGNPDDMDRSGLVYSVPFYGMDGKLKGSISGIFLTSVIRSFLPSDNYALRNLRYDYTIASADIDNPQHSMEWIKKASPDPDLISSEVYPLDIIEGDGKWLLWQGTPDMIFWSREDVKKNRHVALLSYAIVLAITVLLLIATLLIRRNQDFIKENNRKLEEKVKDRTADLEKKNKQLKKREDELEKVHRLEKAMAEEARKANESLSYEVKSKEAISNILQSTIEATSEKAVLDVALKILASLDFLGIKDMGGGFLADQISRSLTLITEQNLNKNQLAACAKIKFGECLCGISAETGDLQHTPCLDKRHEIRYDGIKPHGHYNVPFEIDGKVAGVIVLYLEHGTEFRAECASFLYAVADIIAGAIKRTRAEKATIQTERFASLGAMVAGVAHEINTPVGTAVINVSELNEKAAAFQKKLEGGGIRKSDLENFLQDTRDFSGMAQENLFRAAELVRSFKQVAVDQSSEEEREFNLREQINATITTLYHEFKQTEITIKVDCPAELTITSFPGAFSQIISNLTQNSRIHGFDDGKEAGEIRITVSLDTHKERLTLTYTDNGRGVDEDHKNKIFEPFYTTRRNNGGSGLGMHIVYNLVTKTLGGEIEYESALGQGLSFRIAIPLQENFHHQAMADTLITLEANPTGE